MCKNFARYPHRFHHKSPSNTIQHCWKHTGAHQPPFLGTSLLDRQPSNSPTQHPRTNPSRDTVDNTTQLPQQLIFDDRLCQSWTPSQNLTDPQQLLTLPPSNHTCQSHKSCRHSSSSQNTTSKPIITHPRINQHFQLQLAHPTQSQFSCLENLDQSDSGTIYQTRTARDT